MPSAMAASFVAVRASNCTIPRPAGAVALGMPVHHHGTDDRHLAQIPIACLSDAAQGRLIARGVRDSHLAVTLRFLSPGQRRMVTRR